MRIFITGCARSGTTLLRRLFFAYANVEVIPEELTLESFLVYPDKDKILVGKRSARTLFSHRLKQEVEARQVSIIREARDSGELKVVNTVRDGRVMLYNGQGAKRWLRSVAQAELHSDLIDVTVKYEELVTHPDDIQKRITSALRLTPVYRFSEYPVFFQKDAVSHLDGYTERPLTPDRIYKDFSNDWRIN